MSVATKRITYEMSMTMPENKLEEVVRGESRIMAPPVDRRAFLVQELAGSLFGQLDRKRYLVLSTSFGLGIERAPVLTYRVPDLAVFSRLALEQNRREKDERDPYIWQAPELLAECLSPSNRKGRVSELLEDYSRIAAAEAWLFYPERPRLDVWALEEGGLRLARQLTTGIVEPRGLPGVRVDLEELWAAFRR